MDTSTENDTITYYDVTFEEQVLRKEPPLTGFEFIRYQNDIAVKVPELLRMLKEYQQSPFGVYSKVMMKFRHGWRNNSDALLLMDQLIALLKANGFTELKPETEFTSVAMPQKTYAFYQFHNGSAVDFYPYPDHLLMATHPESPYLTGFMFSWSIKTF
jgi:hypothetical protein